MKIKHVIKCFIEIIDYAISKYIYISKRRNMLIEIKYLLYNEQH